MLLKDKDILSNKNEEASSDTTPLKPKIDKKNMKSAWGDAFDYYIRGITEKYLYFHGRATRLEFFGFMVASGILLFCMYALGMYIDEPLLAYYYFGVTSIPMVSVTVRRFHDLNKKSIFYMLLGVLAGLSSIFSIWLAIILVSGWLIVIAKILLAKTSEEEGIFGAPNENDEIYGNDNELIVRKFFKISVSLGIVFLFLTVCNFDNWKTENEQKHAIIAIEEQVFEAGQRYGLDANEIKKAKEDMRSFLREKQGQMVSQEEINSMVEDIVKNTKKTESSTR